MSTLALDLKTSKQLAAKHPAELSAVELGAVLEASAVLESYITQAREEAEKRLGAGQPVEGWELAVTPGRRSIIDTAKAARQLGPLLKPDQILECATLSLGKVQEAIAEAEQVSPAKAKEIMSDYLKGTIIKSANGTKLQPQPKTVVIAGNSDCPPELKEQELFGGAQ
jgi:hypothetical protein